MVHTVHMYVSYGAGTPPKTSTLPHIFICIALNCLWQQAKRVHTWLWLRALVSLPLEVIHSALNALPRSVPRPLRLPLQIPQGVLHVRSQSPAPCASPPRILPSFSRSSSTAWAPPGSLQPHSPSSVALLRCPPRRSLASPTAPLMASPTFGSGLPGPVHSALHVLLDAIALRRHNTKNPTKAQHQNSHAALTSSPQHQAVQASEPGKGKGQNQSAEQERRVWGWRRWLVSQIAANVGTRGTQNRGTGRFAGAQGGGDWRHKLRHSRSPPWQRSAGRRSGT